MSDHNPESAFSLRRTEDGVTYEILCKGMPTGVTLGEMNNDPYGKRWTRSDEPASHIFPYGDANQALDAYSLGTNWRSQEWGQDIIRDFPKRPTE